MREPPAREQDSGDERLSTRRPADLPASGGEALVEHLADRLQRAERELADARETVARETQHRALLRSVARQLAGSERVVLGEMVRTVLPVLGRWCLLDEVAGGRAERRLVTHDGSRHPLGDELEGELSMDGDASLGIVRVLRRRRIERLARIEFDTQDRIPDDTRGAPGAAALRQLATGPVLVIPVIVRGRIAGAVTFGREGHESEFTESEQRLGEELSHLLGLALEHQRIAAVAESAGRTKSEFLAMMSHELRTPLNAIAGYAQLLEMGFRGPLTDGQRDAVSRILRGQEHLLALVDAVLTFSRLTSGQLAIEERDLDAADLVDAASEPLVVEFASREIDFRILPCPDRARVAADRDRSIEILRHLLSNALKFTPKGGSVTVSCEAGPGLVHIAVADTGRGIPEGQRESIFQPFVQVEKGLTRSADGSGLGLSISRELAERMGGSLTVTSRLGEGSRFVLSLVRASEDSPSVPIDSLSGEG